MSVWHQLIEKIDHFLWILNLLEVKKIDDCLYNYFSEHLKTCIKLSCILHFFKDKDIKSLGSSFMLLCIQNWYNFRSTLVHFTKWFHILKFWEQNCTVYSRKFYKSFIKLTLFLIFYSRYEPEDYIRGCLAFEILDFLFMFQSTLIVSLRSASSTTICTEFPIVSCW